MSTLLQCNPHGQPTATSVEYQLKNHWQSREKAFFQWESPQTTQNIWASNFFVKFCEHKWPIKLYSGQFYTQMELHWLIEQAQTVKKMIVIPAEKCWKTSCFHERFLCLYYEYIQSLYPSPSAHWTLGEMLAFTLKRGVEKPEYLFSQTYAFAELWHLGDDWRPGIVGTSGWFPLIECIRPWLPLSPDKTQRVGFHSTAKRQHSFSCRGLVLPLRFPCFSDPCMPLHVAFFILETC